MLRLATGLEGLDDDHAPATARAWRGKRIRGGRLLVCVRWQGSGEQLAGLRQVFLSGAAGEQAVVANAMEALRQDMQQEAANELGRRQRHGGVAAWPFDPVVLDLEGDAALVGVVQAPVGDGD